METYKVKVECRNCDFDGEVEITKGVSVRFFPCPECWNDTLQRFAKEEDTEKTAEASH